MTRMRRIRGFLRWLAQGPCLPSSPPEGAATKSKKEPASPDAPPPMRLRVARRLARLSFSIVAALDALKTPLNVYRWVADGADPDAQRRRMELVVHLRRNVERVWNGWLRERQLAAALHVWEQAIDDARRRGLPQPRAAGVSPQRVHECHRGRTAAPSVPALRRIGGAVCALRVAAGARVSGAAHVRALRRIGGAVCALRVAAGARVSGAVHVRALRRIGGAYRADIPPAGARPCAFDAPVGCPSRLPPRSTLPWERETTRWLLASVNSSLFVAHNMAVVLLAARVMIVSVS